MLITLALWLSILPTLKKFVSTFWLADQPLLLEFTIAHLFHCLYPSHGKVVKRKWQLQSRYVAMLEALDLPSSRLPSSSIGQSFS